MIVLCVSRMKLPPPLLIAGMFSKPFERYQTLIVIQTSYDLQWVRGYLAERPSWMPHLPRANHEIVVHLHGLIHVRAGISS